MKFLLILVMSALLTSVSQAQSTPRFEQVRLKFRIYKSTIKKVNDDYQTHKEVVCEKSVDMDVSDFRKPASGAPKLSVPQSVVCDFTEDQKTLKVYAFAFNVVDHLDPHEVGTSDDYKLYNAGLNFWFDDGTVDNLPRTDSRFISTKDLNLKNLIIDVVPSQWVLCAQPGMPGQVGQTFKPQGGQSRIQIPRSASSDSCSIRNPVVFGALVEFETIR